MLAAIDLDQEFETRSEFARPLICCRCHRRAVGHEQNPRTSVALNLIGMGELVHGGCRGA